MSTCASFGSWKSPITSEWIVADNIRLDDVKLDGENICWLESRPKDGGHAVVTCRTPDGRLQDLTSRPFDVRSRVHEYGGGAFTIQDNILYFSNWSDQRLYHQEPGHPPQPITPDTNLRYADYAIDSRRKLLYCVREDHRGTDEPVNTLVRLSLNGNERGGDVIVAGNDFYSSPRLSPDGSSLVWLTWNHPNMPWDKTELWIANVNGDGSLTQA